MTGGMRLAAQDVIAAWSIAQSASREKVVTLPSGAAVRLDDLREWAASWPGYPPVGHLPQAPPVGPVYSSDTRRALTARRAALGLSQAQVARLIGLRQSEVCAMERGRLKPGPIRMARWAAALSGQADTVRAGAAR